MIIFWDSEVQVTDLLKFWETECRAPLCVSALKSGGDIVDVQDATC